MLNLTLHMCMLSNNYWPFLVSIHSGVLFYYPTSSFVYYLHCSSHVNTVLTDHSTNKRYLIPVRAIPIFLVFSASASKTYKMTTSRKTTYRCGTIWHRQTCLHCLFAPFESIHSRLEQVSRQSNFDDDGTHPVLDLWVFFFYDCEGRYQNFSLAQSRV